MRKNNIILIVNYTRKKIAMRENNDSWLRPQQGVILHSVYMTIDRNDYTTMALLFFCRLLFFNASSLCVLSMAHSIQLWHTERNVSLTAHMRPGETNSRILPPSHFPVHIYKSDFYNTVPCRIFVALYSLVVKV